MYEAHLKGAPATIPVNCIGAVFDGEATTDMEAVKMKIQRRWLFCGMVMLGSLLVFVSVIWGAISWRQTVREMNHYSAMMWLKTALSEGLMRHYRARGSYPSTIEDLSIEFPGDNAKPEMLGDFLYNTDGEWYELICDVRVKGKVRRYRECGSRGKVTASEAYVDGHLNANN